MQPGGFNQLDKVVRGDGKIEVLVSFSLVTAENDRNDVAVVVKNRAAAGTGGNGRADLVPKNPVGFFAYLADKTGRNGVLQATGVADNRNGLAGENCIGRNNGNVR